MMLPVSSRFVGVLMILSFFCNQIAHCLYQENQSPAIITEPPLDTTAQAGFFILLVCRAQGNPKPTVKFRINGQVPEKETHGKIIRQFDYGASLRQRVQMSDNNHRVECVAENHLGTDIKSATIKVIDSNAESPPGFPTIISGPADVLMQIGKSVKLKCEVNADPRATVVWIKNSITPLDMEDSRFRIVGTGTLYISNLKEQDNGNYECMARNKVGTVISQAASLQIRNSPMTPQIINFKSIIEVSVGQGANLTCNAEGYPIPKVWWAVSLVGIKQNFIKTPESRPLAPRMPSQNTIHITDVTESATYICFATNNMGTVRKTVNIVVKKKPPTPGNVAVRQVGSTYALIEWAKISSEALLASQINSYTLIVRDKTASPQSPAENHLRVRQIASIYPQNLPIDPATNKVFFNVTELKPYTEYDAQIVAVNNEIGRSDPSEPAAFRTTELPPSSAPMDVRAQAIQDYSIVVTWRPPREKNGQITGYKLYHSEKMNVPLSMWTVTRTEGLKHYIHNLKRNATYYVKVNAYNYAGDGPLSDAFPILVTPGETSSSNRILTTSVPAVPQNFRAAALKSFSIQIIWTPPAIPEGTELLNYILKYKPHNDEKAKVITEDISPDKTQYLINGLKPGTMYFISLAGRTKDGVGIAAQVKEKTSDEIPDKPKGHTLTVLGSTSIKVSWRGPENMLDQVKYYIIRWMSRREDTVLNSNEPNIIDNTINNSEEGTIKIDSDKNNPTKQYETVLNNLTPNLYYKIEVRAVSSRGEGRPYIFPVHKTSGEIPSKPRSFGISQLMPLYVDKRLVYANIHLSWKPPEQTNGKIIGYRVTITLIGPPEVVKEMGNTKLFRNTSNPSYSTTEKDNIGYGRRYLFEVEALNEINYGFPARLNQSIDERTPTAQPDMIEIQASKNTVTMNWQPPHINYRNGIIRKYEIQYYNMKNPDNTKKTIFVEGHTSVKIDKLSEDTTYVFMLRAINSKGAGPWSPGSSYYISMEYFPSPENVVAKDLSESEIKITWEYPTKSNFITSLNSEIVGFIIKISPPHNKVSTQYLSDDDKYEFDSSYQRNPSYLNKQQKRRLRKQPSTTIPHFNPMPMILLRDIVPGTYRIMVRCVVRDDRVAEWSRAVTVTVSKAPYPSRQIQKLRCTGMNKAINILWNVPDIEKDIDSFEVSVVGMLKYRRFDDTIHTETLTSISVPLKYSKSKQIFHNYLVDKMKPYTVYDVTITTRFNNISEVKSLSKTTSCSTFMTKPSRVNYPEAIPQKKKSPEIILRLYRAEENQGRISHYYLIVGPVIETHITPSDVNINMTYEYTKRMTTKVRGRFIAAQFTTALFQSRPYADFALGASQANAAFSEDDWIILKNPKVAAKAKYRAFLRACVVSEGLQSRNPGKPSASTLQTQKVPPTAFSLDEGCTSSDWSTVFSTDINKENEMMTIAITSGIGGISLLMFLCIGLVCLMRRRNHDKVNHPINSSNDPYLKQPLMMQQSSSMGRTVEGHNNNSSTLMLNSSTYPNGRSSISVTTAIPTSITAYGINGNNNSRIHGHENAIATMPSSSMGASVNFQHQSPTNKLIQMDQRSLELRKVINCSSNQAPDLVQNVLTMSTSGASSNYPNSGISLHNLANHINELKSNDNLLFSQQYESIDPGQQFSWEHSNMELNRAKNRYANVIAYDHSRVALQNIDGVLGSDYINANYIDGYKKANYYIATQGPLSNTFGDFWRMVWEQESTIIVMMTKLEERTRVKCDQYWPNKGTESYADGVVSVSLLDTQEMAYYTIRTFSLAANYVSNLSEINVGMSKREVKQYQFTAWPDHGVPDNPIPLLMFLRRVRAGTTMNCGPIIVHCSAGVGRTGAFIAIDASLERARQEGSVDIFSQVSRMRSRRNYMVQTEEQYVFVHEVILDSVRAGCTEVVATAIPSHVQTLLRSSPNNMNQMIEIEFQKLAMLKPSLASLTRCTSANLPVNRLKNRLVNILPYEHSRVCLQPIRGCEGSDYINASFIDGYYSTKAYIATQAPLLETVEDFWRMIWELNSTIIVMLTKLKELGREKCHRYWPSERSSRYQYFVVDPMVEYNMPNFVLQEFKVTDARDGQSRTVRQFQFTEWPEQGVPFEAGEAFIDFIGQVHKTKEQFGQEGPITVHCSAGVGRTGVFLALSISLERLRKEGVIDLFQTIRMLRHQRANMIQSDEQYKFCYLALQDYVTSFDNTNEL